MQEGMIVSNEPGYYQLGSHGIRIENLVIVTDTGEKEGGKKIFELETITKVPIDQRMIDNSLLDDQERQWLNDYHQDIRDELMPRLKGDENEKVRSWLIRATKEIESDR
ncbi:MAG: M24 family metallopeptidase C-terminal domain-containing protein, partial [Planctomycetes bacterium]|nr:M24 family metallopeptidase C-terminal domain-containing protein [Planctomycetota bacterium]